MRTVAELRALVELRVADRFVGPPSRVWKGSLQWRSRLLLSPREWDPLDPFLHTLHVHEEARLESRRLWILGRLGQGISDCECLRTKSYLADFWLQVVWLEQAVHTVFRERQRRELQRYRYTYAGEVSSRCKAKFRTLLRTVSDVAGQNVLRTVSGAQSCIRYEVSRLRITYTSDRSADH